MQDSYGFTSRLAESTNRLWGCHFVVPDAIAQVFLANSGKRVVCTLNEVHQYQCALTPIGEGQWVILVNKALQKKLRLGVGSEVRASLCADTSEYGLPMPEELVEVLAQDALAKTLFEALTPGKQRTLLYIIGQPKQVDKRIERALAISNHLKSQKGKIDFKVLHHDLKSTSL